MKKLIIVPFLFIGMQAKADLLEVGLGTTFHRFTPGDTGAALNLAYVKRDQRFPIEYGVGFIEGSKMLKGPLHKNQIYISVGLRKYWNGFFMGGGLALARDTNLRLSSHLNIKTQLGYTYKSLTFKVEHISNGSTFGENDGESFYLITYNKEL